MRSRTPALQYLLLNVLPYQITVPVHKAENVLQAFYKHIVFWICVKMFMVFLILALHYASNMLEIVGST